MTTTKLAPDNCTSCGRDIDAATAAGGEITPEPGDITVCAYCGAAMVFGKDLRVAPISRQLWATLGAEEKGHISRAQHIIRAMRPETLH